MTDKTINEMFEYKQMMKKFETKYSDDELSDYELTEKDLYPSEARKNTKK